jgi:hypothetical protein
VLYFGFARGRAKRRFLKANVSAGNITLCRGYCRSIGPVLENDHDTATHYYYYTTTTTTTTTTIYIMCMGWQTKYVIYKNWMIQEVPIIWVSNMPFLMYMGIDFWRNIHKNSLNSCTSHPWISLTHIYIISYELRFSRLNVSALHCVYLVPIDHRQQRPPSHTALHSNYDSMWQSTNVSGQMQEYNILSFIIFIFVCPICLQDEINSDTTIHPITFPVTFWYVQQLMWCISYLQHSVICPSQQRDTDHYAISVQC